MSTYSDASFIISSAGGYKEGDATPTLGKIYNLKPDGATYPYMTVTRATEGSRTNKDGDTEVVPVNTAVIDWISGVPYINVGETDVITVAMPTGVNRVLMETIDGSEEIYNYYPNITLPVGYIKSIIATTDTGYEYDLLYDYLYRIDTAGSDTISNDGGEDVLKVYQYLDSEGLLADTKLVYVAGSGMIQRVDGVLKYIRTAYDISSEDNDLDGSATASQQPRLVGGIAPNSKPAAANLNGESRYFTHLDISFADGDEWSITSCLSLFGDIIGNPSYLCGDITKTGTIFSIDKDGSGDIISFRSNSGNSIVSGITHRVFLGKKNVLTITSNSAKLITFFINGVSVYSATALTTDGVFNSLMRTRDTTTAHYTINGNINFYKIQSGALTAQQVADEADFIRNTLSIPEIESVEIGSQTWSTRNFEAVATPVGNVIANVTENGAVEKITNAADREFSSDTGFWSKTAGVTIDLGVCNIKSTAGENQYIVKTGLTTAGKWYEFTYDIKRNAGGSLAIESGTDIVLDSTVGDAKSKIYKAGGISFILKRYNICDIDIDNISIQELNWSNATEIYDAVYAATAGTSAEKEYAALKEAAMWCYYDNNPDNGAIYGKLYNWYAAKLLDLDMATAGFGWRVPTSTDFSTLTTTLGGASVAGGKMKMTGLDYWTTPNTGATNESGFTGLGSGWRGDDGSFIEIKYRSVFATIDNQAKALSYNSETLSGINYITNKLRGASIRLIKTT